MRSDIGCRPAAPYWMLHQGRKGGDETEAFTRRPNPRARSASGPHLSKLHRLPIAAQIKEEPDIQPCKETPTRKAWPRSRRKQRALGQVRRTRSPSATASDPPM